MLECAAHSGGEIETENQSLNGLLTGAAGQINGTTALGHNLDWVGVGTGVYSLGAPRQLEFGVRLTF
jgi:hypothetical protein